MVCKKIGVSKEEKEYRILIRPGPTANADALSPDAELYQDRDGRRHGHQLRSRLEGQGDQLQAYSGEVG